MLYDSLLSKDSLIKDNSPSWNKDSLIKDNKTKF